MHALGLKDALEKVQVLPAGKAIRLWNTGQSWKLFDLGLESVERYGFPYITIHRGDLHGVIAQAVLQAKPGAINLSRKCVGLSQTPDHVELRFETGAPVTAKLVVGADGVHSVVRENLFGAAKPNFCGIIAWRGVMPMERVPASISRSIGTNWVGPGGHVVHYPLRAGTLLNFVGMGERDWTVEGWNVRGTTEEVLSDFRGWHADVHALIRNIDVPYKWGWRCGRPWSNGAKAAARCSATPAIRWCRCWPKARSWRSRTASCWRGPSKNIRTITKPRWRPTRRRAATAPTRSSPAQLP